MDVKRFEFFEWMRNKHPQAVGKAAFNSLCRAEVSNFLSSVANVDTSTLTADTARKITSSVDSFCGNIRNYWKSAKYRPLIMANYAYCQAKLFNFVFGNNTS